MNFIQRDLRPPSDAEQFDDEYGDAGGLAAETFQNTAEDSTRGKEIINNLKFLAAEKPGNAVSRTNS